MSDNLAQGFRASNLLFSLLRAPRPVNRLPLKGAAIVNTLTGSPASAWRLPPFPRL